jgi:hypothetical protein
VRRKSLATVKIFTDAESLRESDASRALTFELKRVSRFLEALRGERATYMLEP